MGSSCALDFPYIVSQLGRFVKGFLEIFSRKLRAGRLGHTQPLPTVRHLAWVSQLPRCSLPLTPIVYHTYPHIARWNNAQNRDSKLFLFCATFCLTNCWRCVIMEILRASPVGAPPKKPPQKWGGFRISWADLRPWPEASSEPCPRLTYTLQFPSSQGRGRVPRGSEFLPPAVLPGRTLPRRCWG